MDALNRTSGWGRTARWLPLVLLAAAPALQAQYYSRRYVPPSENTSETNRHLSPACATLNDAIATANRQGQYTTAQSAQQEFNRKCADEMQDAMQKRYQQQQGERDRRMDEKRQAELAQDQAAQLAQQCEGMRDVIALRRKRERDNALNPTEVQALRQLEASYNGRCLRR